MGEPEVIADIITAGVVLLGLCAMICYTVLHIEQMRTTDTTSHSVDDEVLKAILKFEDFPNCPCPFKKK